MCLLKRLTLLYIIELNYSVFFSNYIYLLIPWGKNIVDSNTFRRNKVNFTSTFGSNYK